jgi:hypothetical protein
VGGKEGGGLVLLAVLGIWGGDLHHVLEGLGLGRTGRLMVNGR